MGRAAALIFPCSKEPQGVKTMSIQTQLDRINGEVSAQASQLAELKTALEGKAGIGNGTTDTCSLKIMAPSNGKSITIYDLFGTCVTDGEIYTGGIIPGHMLTTGASLTETDPAPMVGYSCSDGSYPTSVNVGGWVTFSNLQCGSKVFITMSGFAAVFTLTSENCTLRRLIRHYSNLIMATAEILLPTTAGTEAIITHYID